MATDGNFPELYESHEAGHVVVASVLGIVYSHVTVEGAIPSHGGRPHVWIDNPLLLPDSPHVRGSIPEHLHSEVWPLAKLSLAGITSSIANTPADRRPFAACFFRFLAENDITLIDDLFKAEELDGSDRSRLVLETVDLVYAQWSGIRAIIEALSLRKTLGYAEVEAILAGRSGSSLAPPQPKEVTLDFVRRSLLLAEPSQKV